MTWTESLAPFAIIAVVLAIIGAMVYTGVIESPSSERARRQDRLRQHGIIKEVELNYGLYLIEMADGSRCIVNYREGGSSCEWVARK